MSDTGKSSGGVSKSTTGRRPLYYGGNRPIPQYGGRLPMVFDGSGGGVYGSNYYYGSPMGGAGGEGDDSIMGAVTIGRMLRVCSQRWVTILVFVLLGLVGAFAFYRISPVIYESESIFEMNVRKPSIVGKGLMMEDVSGTFSEVFNTRLARLRSRAVIDQIMTQYRSDYPSSTIDDGTLLSTLINTKITLVRQSRLVRVTVRSTDPRLAAELANAYAKAAETFTAEQNRSESDTAVAWLASTTEQKKRALERANKDLLDFRVSNRLGLMANESEITQQAIQSLNTEILSLEGQITVSTELRRTLEMIQNEPDRFAALPDTVPRSGEIGQAYQVMQRAQTERNSMLARYTANHPEVKLKEKEVEAYGEMFKDVIYRSLETCKANLDLLERQLARLVPKRDELNEKLSNLELEMDSAKIKLQQLELERDLSEQEFRDLLQRTSAAQLANDENTAIIKQVEQAYEPRKPVLPNGMLIFPAGPLIGLVLGVMFVLILDHLEDKIVGISDIEQRLRLKVLAVLPHVRRNKREQVARLSADDKFSQFAEGVAGLRNLLDSPRYREMSKVLLCMSTQPGEGKTISSCNLAISSAHSGQRTLLVDFDLRRPRLDRIFSKKPSEFNSLPHALIKNEPSLFDTLPVASDVENLDLILSKASSEISPASLMGSDVILDFFQWARERYDRIMIDSPPFGIVGDVVSLAIQADAVMIMCCPDRTRFQPIKHAARHLTEAGARVIGVIVNDVDFGKSNQFGQHEYHYRYAYRYTARYGAYRQGASEAAASKQKSHGGDVDIRGGVSVEDDLTPASLSRQDMVDSSMVDDE